MELTLWPERRETICGLVEAIRAKELSCTEVVDRYLKRIQRVEHHLDAWAHLDPEDVMAQARYLDDLARRDRWLGALHGVPVAIKDIIRVAGWPTACGFPPWRTKVSKTDAWVVRRLRAAGAIILGKTVTTQFAAFDPPPTANPWSPDRTPGGSSSGSAAALAAGLCPAALGTQTGGSILRPAAYCGVVGLKPTYQRVSRRGVWPVAPSLDHVGPMARTVYDVALLLDAISGPDPFRRHCQWPATATTRRLDAAPLPRRVRIGVVAGYYRRNASDEAWAITEKMASLLARTGQNVSSSGAWPQEVAEAALTVHRTIMAVEAAHVHRSTFPRYRDDYAPRIRQLIEEGQQTGATDYLAAIAARKRFRRYARALFNDHDVLIMPTTPAEAPDRSTTGPPAFQSLWSLTGLPAVHVPVRLGTQNLPLGVQLVAGPGKEWLLLAVAARVEHLARHEHA